MATIVQLQSSKPVILLDTSYFIFYRYFSTLKWYEYTRKDIDYSAIHEDPIFMEAFRKHVLQDFKKMCKQWDSSLNNMVLCCDCMRGQIWRNEFHDNYKGLRVQSTSFNPHIFTKFYEYIEEKTPEWGLHQLAYDKLEADDIVYLVKTKLGDTTNVVIITNDNDYLQLLDGNTRIYNMNGAGMDLSKRSCGDPAKDLKIKLIMGDKSDNIASIHSGIGPKTAMKLASLSDEEFNAYLDKRNCKEIYLNNKRLMDFNEIPRELCNAFQETYVIEWVVR